MSRDVVFTIANVMMWLGLAPLVACGIQAVRKRPLPPDLVLLAAGFAVSLLNDMMARDLALQGLPNWYLSFIFPPIQLSVWAMVIVRKPEWRMLVVPCILLTAFVSAQQAMQIPEWRKVMELVVRDIGGIALAIAILAVPFLRRFRLPMLLTMVGGAIGVTLLATVAPGDRLEAWFGHQGVRLVALCLMVRALFLPPLEATDGAGTTGLAGEDRGLDRLHRVHSVAGVQAAER